MSAGISCFDFNEVSFAWPGGKTILDRQSFSLAAGVLTLVRGPSGAGKSTLLRLMNRLEEAGSGTIRYRGKMISDWAPPALRQQVAYLQQTPVIPDRSVREILLMPFDFDINSEKTPPSKDALHEMLAQVRMEDISLDDPAAALSGGQRQRLSLLRTLVTAPEVLLLDEPTASLDSESKRCVEEVTEGACRQGTAVVMITHDGYTPENLPVAELTLAEGRVSICR
ncbi:MAG: ATP-binding cassette domain-containing protein [Desulfobacterales bacterium]|nr:ATP-binding cassette domain-containing protein [Desulfobacterales bacterium]